MKLWQLSLTAREKLQPQVWPKEALTSPVSTSLSAGDSLEDLQISGRRRY